jgi:hypothetical protein
VNTNASRPDQRWAGLTHAGLRHGSFPKIHVAEKTWKHGERGGSRREARLQVDRVLEEEPEVALRAWIVRREQSGGEREESEHRQRRSDPAVRPARN